MSNHWKWHGEKGNPGCCLYCGELRLLHREDALPTDCPQLAVMKAQDQIAEQESVRGVLNNELKAAVAEAQSLRAALREVGDYVAPLDGLPGSPMWRIKTDVRAILAKYVPES